MSFREGVELHHLQLRIANRSVAVEGTLCTFPSGNTIAASALAFVARAASPIGMTMARPGLHACAPSVTIAWAPDNGPSGLDVLVCA